MAVSRLSKLIACVALLFSTSATPEEPWEGWNWGSEISTSLLFHPPRRIELGDREVRFIAREFTYAYLLDSNRWMVTPAQNEIMPIEGWGMPGTEIRQVRTTQGPLMLETPDPGTLSIGWSSCPQPLGPVQLWTRAQLGQVWFEYMVQRWGPPPASPEKAAEMITVSDAYVADWDEDTQNIWLAVRFYAGEGSVGIGTIVQIRKQACTVRLIQPPELALYSISRVVRARGNLWLATEHFGESGTGPGVGLVRYDLQTGRVEFLRRKSAFLGSRITDVARSDELLWVATIDGFGEFNLQTQRLRSWGIVPRLELTKSTPVSSLLGGGTRSWIAAGHHEVRWVGGAYAEIVTPDCTEGSVESSWYDTLKARKFDSSSTSIARSMNWSITGLSLYSSPQRTPPKSPPTGWFLRVPAKPQGKAESGWQPVSVCAGWVEIAGSKIQLTVSPD